MSTAKGYFSEHLCVGDYYAQGQKTTGNWFGLGAGRLNLGAVVSERAFVRLCENRHPTDDQRLTQRQRKGTADADHQDGNRRVFFDFTFSPPKSVSVMGLAGGDSRILQAHQDALKTALDEFETFAATRVRKNGADDLRKTGGVVAALFTHETSRALDPHLHTHCIVFNATFDPVEKCWKALQNYEMLRARKYAENVYYHELAQRLIGFGYRIRNNPRGDFEIEGVSEEICQRFSKRHAQIDDGLKRLLEEKPELARASPEKLREHIATSERSRKIREVGPTELRQSWSDQLSPEERFVLAQSKSRQTIRPESSMTVEQAVDWAEEHLFDRHSLVQEHTIWQVALDRARGATFAIAELQAATRNRGYIRSTEDEVTTREVLAREWEIVNSARESIGGFSTLVRNPSSPHLPLDVEQVAALHQLQGSRDGVALFRGGAGTGKSFVLQELVQSLENSGRSVCVLVPQRQQVVEFEKTGFKNPTTVADFLIRRNLAKGAVVVVDEAGQIGGKQMLELLRLVRSRNGRLVLSGDTRQHGPVEASDALIAIEKHSGIRPAELHTIRRQDPARGKTDDERNEIELYRQAVAAAADGNLRRSFERLDSLGAIVPCSLSDQQEKLAAEYLRLAESGSSTVVVSQTWNEVRKVNEQVRAGMKAKHLIQGDDTLIETLEPVDLTDAQKRDARSFPAGTVVAFNQPFRSLPAGARGSFVAADERGVILEVDGRIVPVPKHQLKRVSAFKTVQQPVARGERLLLKANRRLSDGSKVSNGELVTVELVQSDGTIRLADGRSLDSSYREFLPGYAITSYGAQGKTVDYILFSDSTVKTATNNQQWYVTISRGRRGIKIFTPDKRQLRLNVLRSGHRPLAVDLAGGPLPRRLRNYTLYQSFERGIRRFGERACRFILNACRLHRSPITNRKHHEHKTSRPLDH